MKTLAISKTVKPARICQNYEHWKQYIKAQVLTIKNKQ